MASLDGVKPELHLPEYVQLNGGMRGRCTVPGVPRTLRVTSQRRNNGCGTIVLPKNPATPRNTLEFEVKNVAESCVYKCIASGGSRDLKLVTVVDGPKIVTMETDLIVYVEKGLPVTLSCDVTGDHGYYWVGWVHEGKVMRSGDQYSITASQREDASNVSDYFSHQLIVHSATATGTYTCIVYGTDSAVRDSVDYQIVTSEGNDDDSQLLSTLHQYFFWNW